VTITLKTALITTKVSLLVDQAQHGVIPEKKASIFISTDVIYENLGRPVPQQFSSFTTRLLSKGALLTLRQISHNNTSYWW